MMMEDPGSGPFRPVEEDAIMRRQRARMSVKMVQPIGLPKWHIPPFTASAALFRASVPLRRVEMHMCLLRCGTVDRIG